jgi:uroporphyrin-III C-methyltransferase/precorrin-2 dehydrogenase/sirohydrochlorin ferrochelatase
VALRKVLGLVEAGALVRVVAPEVEPGIDELVAAGKAELDRRRYEPGEVAGNWLVIAATDDRSVNARVYEDCEAAGIWCNVADDPEYCAFHLPGRVKRGPLEIAIGSGGGAPFLTRRLRQVLEERISPEWSAWVDAAARLRAMVRDADLPPARQEEIYDRFFESTLDPRRLTVRVPGDGHLERIMQPGGLSQASPRARRAEGAARGDDGPAPGLVSLVGAGPGNAGLMTVWGRRRLFEADAVVFDRLAAPAIPGDLPERVTLHSVGKTSGNHPVPQDEITETLVRLAREGKRVVRLKGGDPYVFGRGGEEAEVLAAAGIPFEIVPGVTSGIAAPAFAGIPVTHRREAVRVTLVTAHETIKSEGPQVRWDLLAQDRASTIVGYMGVTAIPNVVAELMAYGMEPDTPAAMIERGSTSAQRHVVSTLAKLPEAVEEGAIRPPALFVIGPTVEHAARLDWAGSLPLGGERLVVPVSRRGLVTALERSGAEVVVTPLPVTEAARLAMNALPLTGIVAGGRGEIDAVDEERGGLGFHGEVVVWCLDEAAALRAEERGWRHVERLGVHETHERAVEEIARRRT